jgi:hypothetical protein
MLATSQQTRRDGARSIIDRTRRMVRQCKSEAGAKLIGGTEVRY